MGGDALRQERQRRSGTEVAIVLQTSVFYPPASSLAKKDSAPTHRARETVDLLTRRLQTSFLTRFAAKQPRLKSGGLQSEISNEGLQKAVQRRRRTAFAYPESRQRGTNLSSALLIWQSGIGACVFVRVIAKAGHCEYKLSH